jgi:hypothetical protein
MRFGTWIRMTIEPSQRKDKSDYYFSFKTRLEDRPEKMPESRAGRDSQPELIQVNVRVKILIIIVLKLNLGSTWGKT